jgi:hypothetical protein
MDYRARVSIDLTFHSTAALHQTLAGLARTGTLEAAPWDLAAHLSEFADVHLHHLHLTGHGTGRLLHNPAHLLDLLARHADGTLLVHGEDGTSWQITLRAGRATAWRLPPGDPVLGPDLIPEWAALAPRTTALQPAPPHARSPMDQETAPEPDSTVETALRAWLDRHTPEPLP